VIRPGLLASALGEFAVTPAGVIVGIVLLLLFLAGVLAAVLTTARSGG